MLVDGLSVGVAFVHRQADAGKALFFRLLLHQAEQGAHHPLAAALGQNVGFAQVHLLLALVAGGVAHKAHVRLPQLGQDIAVVFPGHLLLHRVVGLELLNHVVRLAGGQQIVVCLMPDGLGDGAQGVYLALGGNGL